MKKLSNILIFLIILNFMSCSHFVRNRRFVEEMERDTDGMFVPGDDFNVVAGDTGRAYRTRAQVYARTPGSSYGKTKHQRDYALEQELFALESSQNEFMGQQYEQYKDQFNSVGEKVYFLKLGSPTEREDYLKSRGLINDQFRVDRKEINFAIQSRDIILGMTQDDVIQSWGRPNRVDVAGRAEDQNERWSFYYNGQLKQVFFENGIVHGWKID